MKKFLFLLLPAAMVLSCSDNKSTSENSTSDSKTASKMDDNDKDADDENVTLPYTIPKEADWVAAPKSNVAVAMNTLRAYEMNDMTGIQQYLADTVEFYVDNYEFKGSRDSTVKMFAEHRKGYDTVFIRMHDYESVKSKGRGDQWVSLWYTETSKMKGGKLDSAMVMDDIKIVNGKVALIDSKMRRLVAKKK